MSCFFFNDTATTEIYTLSLHDALPILVKKTALSAYDSPRQAGVIAINFRDDDDELIGAELCSAADEVLLISKKGQAIRSEEHTSELQSRQYLVCRLLLEKKKQAG